MLLKENEFSLLFVNEEICKSLDDAKIIHPTPIQSLVLPKAIRDHVDVLGAAPTGSGKTLAFGVPLLTRVIESKIDKKFDKKKKVFKKLRVERSKNDLEIFGGFDIIEELDPNTGDKVSAQRIFENDVSNEKLDNPITGLVVVPTRELAIQVRDHLIIYTKHLSVEIKILAIVGGISIEKQIRLLKKKPDIIVATPGRLWELLNQENEHLLTMQGNLKCLVIDEADRLLENQHFEELGKVLRFIYSNSSTSEIEQEQNSMTTLHVESEEKRRIKVDFGKLSNTKKRKIEKKKQNKDFAFRRKIQILVFSATLTFVHKDALQLGGHKKQIKGKAYRYQTKEMKLDLLRTQIGMSDHCLLVDLSNKMEALVECNMLKSAPVLNPDKDDSVAPLTTGIIGPQTLEEFRILCPNKNDKDSRLLWFLLRYRAKASEFDLPNQRTLVFINSKSNLRRLAGLFRLIASCGAFSKNNSSSASFVNILHADMTQKYRLKAVERFQSDPNGILFASDVASRGLDLARDEGDSAGVAFVIHFEVPHTAEIYIHRRGRVARAGRKGISILLMEPGDAPRWRKLCQSLKREEKDWPALNSVMDARDLEDCKFIVDTGSKIDIMQNRANKKAAATDWFIKAAKEADLDLDERDLEQSLTHGIFNEELEGWQKSRSKKNNRKTELDFAKRDLAQALVFFKKNHRGRFIPEIHGLKFNNDFSIQ